MSTLEPNTPPGDRHRPDPCADTPAPPPPPAASTLRRSSALTPLDPPEPADASFAATRLTALAHDLANILDGSLRSVSLAQRAALASPASDPDLLQRLDTLHNALRHMADLVRSAMDGVAPDAPLGRRRGLLGAWTLPDAIRHAADVLRPLADDHRITIRLSIAPELEREPAGPLYPVIANALRNAVEAIVRRGNRAGGSISITAFRLDSPDHPAGLVRIEIQDDGEGPPPLPSTERWRVFAPGFSTKARGRGHGLAIARDTLNSLGGVIELAPRDDGQLGAILRITYPLRPTDQRTTPGGGPTP